MVQHTGGSYPVIVRAGVRATLAAHLREHHHGRKPAVIIDAGLAAVLDAPLMDAPHFPFPAGEASKTRDTWALLTDALIAGGFDRRSIVVACGGGVATDLGGFVAATFLRGVPWIAVPTTTLAMLDAAIGGKTGVNTQAGKNLVGAFHPPVMVLADPSLLGTLPERNYREGLAEAVKHAVTLDPGYADWIAEQTDAIANREPAALERLIHRSVELKAGVVTEDEREGDRRAVLNAGHTVAHGLERASGYTLSHGEAVAIGLVIETRVAEAMGIAAPATAERIAGLLHALQLPTAMPRSISVDHVLSGMHSDKKNRDGVIHAALIARIGTMAREGDRWTLPLDMHLVRSALSNPAGSVSSPT